MADAEIIPDSTPSRRESKLNFSSIASFFASLDYLKALELERVFPSDEMSKNLFYIQERLELGRFLLAEYLKWISIIYIASGVVFTFIFHVSFTFVSMMLAIFYTFFNIWVIHRYMYGRGYLYQVVKNYIYLAVVLAAMVWLTLDFLLAYIIPFLLLQLQAYLLSPAEGIYNKVLQDVLKQFFDYFYAHVFPYYLSALEEYRLTLIFKLVAFIIPAVYFAILDKRGFRKTVQDYYKEKILSLPDPSLEKLAKEKKGVVYVGKGMEVKTRETGYLLWEKVNQHMIVFGASGYGKSEMLSRLTYEDIVQGYQSFNIDPKGSKSWIESFFRACDKVGALKDKNRYPIIMNLTFPETSFRFNVLYGLEPEQIASLVTTGVPEGSEPIFKNFAYEITLAVSLGLKSRGVEQITFGDIYKYLNVEGIKDLYAQILQDLNANPKYKKEAQLTLDKIQSYDPQYFPRVNSSLRTYLTRLVTGKAGYLLNVRTDSQQGDLLRKRIDEGNLYFFAFLNAEKEKQVAYDIARLLFAWLLEVVGEKSQKFTKIEPQLRVNVDEVTEIAMAEINQAIRLVRERNVAMKLFTQSPSGFATKLGPQGKQIVQDVVNSCDLRIAFKIGEPQDQQYFADMSGTVSKSKAIVHSGSIAFTYYQDTLIGPKDLDSLEPGWFYAFLNGQTYLGYSPMLKDRRPVVIKWNDTTVTGIEALLTGDKEKHQKSGSDSKDVIEVNISEIEEMLKKLSQVQDVDLSLQESNINKAVKKEQNKESQVVYADTTKLAKSYNTGQYSVPLSPELIKFQEQYESFFQYRKDDFIKILNLLDEFGNAPSVSNPNNPKAQISLMTHSLNVARKSFELMKNMDIPQEEKEIKFLASLAHDIGKAIVSMDPLSTHYSKEEHQKATEEILRNKQISEDIIAATRHHGSGSDNIVVQADKEARQDEDSKLAITNTVKMKQSKGEILNRIIEIVDQTYSCVAIGTTIYIDQEILYSILEEVLGFQPSANDILQTYGWEPVAVNILQNKQLIISGTYFKIKERLSMEMQTKIAAKKQSPDYKMKGLQVEEKS